MMPTTPTPTVLRAVVTPSVILSPTQAVLGAQQHNTSDVDTSRSIYIGAWTEGLWDDTKKELHPERLKSLEDLVDKKFAIAHYYRGWDALADGTLITELTTLHTAGWRPMVSANPYFFNRCESRGKNLYKAIADGHCDDFLKEVGKNLARFPHPVFFRFAWEMNLPTTEWGPAKAGSTATDFVGAWRHMRDILYAEGATNMLWVFSPNTSNTQSIPYAQLYPGDTYVDWVGLDGYNWGTTQSWSSWQSFDQVFSQSYKELSAVAPTKPMMLAEVNSTHEGGDKAAWYTDMFTFRLPSYYPKVAALVLYNEDRSAKEQVNWKVDINPKSLQALISSLKQPLYKSSF